MKQLSDVKFSTLDLVPVRENGSPAQSLRNSLDLAQHVEKFGYTRFWVAEHHNMAELVRYLGPRTPDQRVIAMPGTGTNVPIWLLGSSLFSAQLAGERGLPYAFASHFAPRFMHEAIRVYRNHFKPSAVLDKPYVMLGVPLVAADTDEQADYLATSVYQRILALMRGQSLVQRPPVKTMDGLWLPHEREAVGDFLGLAMVGSPQKIRAKLEVLVEQTQADELIFTSDLYEHADRVHSYELLAQVMKG